jgi:outer membrane receptor protein involved in Fe transport
VYPGVILTPHKNWGVKLLRGEAFRAPLTVETDLSDDPNILTGNKNLKPENITTYDAQLFFHDEKTYAAVTYFYSTIEDQINYTDTPPWSYTNKGEQQFKGIEFEAKRFLTPHWHILGSFMHQENKLDSTFENPRPEPANMIKFGTAYTWDWGTASIFCSFFSKPPGGSDPIKDNPEPKAINLVNTNINLDLSKWMGLRKGQSTLTFRIENLFNEKIYVPPFDVVPNSVPYGPGITFYAGLTVNF